MELLKTTITVLSIETKTTKNGKTMFKIKGSDNKSYQLWQSKQDGTDSMAYIAFSSIPKMGVGKTFDISYREEQGEYGGKTIIYRTIANAIPVKQEEDEIETAQSKVTGEDEKWKGIRDEKRNDIKWMNAINNASLIISKKIDSFAEYSIEDAKKDVKELANWYYKLEPYFVNDNLPDELDKAIANIPF
jgi:hypothetical protein